MDELNRTVAGLRCRDVLEHLSAYVDGELDPSVVRSVNAHLAGWDRCERFGGRFAGIVAALRGELAVAEGLSAGVEARLRERVRAL